MAQRSHKQKHGQFISCLAHSNLTNRPEQDNGGELTDEMYSAVRTPDNQENLRALNLATGEFLVVEARGSRGKFSCSSTAHREKFVLDFFMECFQSMANCRGPRFK